MDHSFFIQRARTKIPNSDIVHVTRRPVLKGNNKALAENGEDGIAMLMQKMEKMGLLC